MLADESPSTPTPHVYIKRVISGSVVKRVLPWMPSRTSVADELQSLLQVVVVKNDSLEFCTWDTEEDPAVWQTVAEQFVFGQVKDVKVITVKVQQEPPATCWAEQCWLVALSDSGFLSFVHLEHASNATGFRFTPMEQIALVDLGLNYDKLGHMLSVDPFSRAIAVASYGSGFRLWLLPSYQKPLLVSVEELSQRAEEGVVWLIEFLFPADDDASNISFILVKSVEGAVHVVVYHYRTKERELHRCNAQIIAHDTIPLSALGLSHVPGAFIITTDAAIHYGQVDVNFNWVQIVELPQPGEHQASEHRLPTIASMTGTRSSPCLRSPSGRPETIYMVTELGLLYRAQLIDIAGGRSLSYTPLYDAQRRVSQVSVIGIANGFEYLAVYGDMCDGEILRISSDEASSDFALINWSPVLDFALADVYRDGRDAMLLACGAKSHSTLREIRNGLNVDSYASVKETVIGEVDGMWSARATESEEQSIVITSFSVETKILRLADGVLEDVTDIAHAFITDSATICAKMNIVDRCIIQIAPHAVAVILWPANSCVSEWTRIAYWTPSVPGGITRGDVCGRSVILACGGGTILHLRTESHAGGISLVEIASKQLGTEVSSVYCSNATPGAVIVGTYDGTIVMMSILNNKPLDVIWQADLHNSLFALRANAGEPQSEEPLIPHSFMTIPGGVVLAGLRNGELAVYHFDKTLSNSRIPPSIFRVGVEPVTLVSSYDGGCCLALSDQLCRISSSSAKVNDVSVLAVETAKVSHAAPLYALGIMGFLTISKASMSFLAIGSEKSSQKVRTTCTVQHARRILCDSETRKLIVAGEKAGTGELSVVHPLTGKCYMTLTCEPGEKIRALAEWQVKPTKRYVCVGTHNYRSATGIGGRVLVYNLKAYERKGEERREDLKRVVTYKMKLLGEVTLDSGVNAMESFLGSYLLAVAGNVFYQLKIDAGTRKLVIRTHLSMRWTIQSLSTFGTRACLGGGKEGCIIYTYDVVRKTWEFYKSERINRAVADCLMIDEQTCISVDKSGGLIGHTTGDPSTLERILDSLFAYNFGEIVTRLRLGNLSSRVRPSSTGSSLTVRSWRDVDPLVPSLYPPVPLILYGTSILGSVYAIAKLSSPFGSKLGVVQDVFRQKMKPILGGDWSRFRNQSTAQRCGAIDGELMAWFLKLEECEKQQIVKEVEKAMCEPVSVEEVQKWIRDVETACW
ncbi:hypothetical protein HDU85_005336 [Gaertneriomyces sp. JEL0708]|nr:hypothetical protein HDU85_005336 [Gaertneriomyces sp. JEL0708]